MEEEGGVCLVYDYDCTECEHGPLWDRDKKSVIDEEFNEAQARFVFSAY